jgi:hypothetical protein
MLEADALNEVTQLALARVTAAIGNVPVECRARQAYEPA